MPRGGAENGRQRPWTDGYSLGLQIVHTLAVVYRLLYQPQQQERAQCLHRDQGLALAAPWFGPLMA